MASFEEEALSRAQQMHRRTPYYNSSRQNAQSQASTQNAEQKRPAQNQQSSEVRAKISESSELNQVRENGNLLNTLFENKEQSLILLLIILLMEDNSEPTLLIALIYLLM